MGAVQILETLAQRAEQPSSTDHNATLNVDSDFAKINEWYEQASDHHK